MSRWSLARLDVPDGVEIYEIRGPCFFRAAESFNDTVGRVADTPKVLILGMRDVPAMDSIGRTRIGLPSVGA